MVTSAIPTEPAMFQCTFSKVTQKNVARKKKSAASRPAHGARLS